MSATGHARMRWNERGGQGSLEAALKRAQRLAYRYDRPDAAATLAASVSSSYAAT
jgi:hypothetical protein